MFLRPRRTGFVVPARILVRQDWLCATKRVLGGHRRSARSSRRRAGGRERPYNVDRFPQRGEDFRKQARCGQRVIFRHMEHQSILKNAPRMDQRKHAIAKGVGIHFQSVEAIDLEPELRRHELRKVLQVAGLGLEMMRRKVHSFRPDDPLQVFHGLHSVLSPAPKSAVDNRLRTMKHGNWACTGVTEAMSFFQKYELLRLLHEGEAKTFKALERATGRQVLFHMLTGDQRKPGSLLEKVQRLRGAPGLIEIGEFANSPYVVTEYSERFTKLSEWLEQQPVSGEPAEAQRFLRRRKLDHDD